METFFQNHPNMEKPSSLLLLALSFITAGVITYSKTNKVEFKNKINDENELNIKMFGLSLNTANVLKEFEEKTAPNQEADDYEWF